MALPGRPVNPPRRLSLLMRYVHGVDLVQVTSLDLVGLLQQRGRSKQHCSKDSPDEQGVEARIPAEGFLEVVALDGRKKPTQVAQRVDQADAGGGGVSGHV